MLAVRQPIVVGVDESVESQTALRYALRRARKLGCNVDVVTSWSTSQDDGDEAEARAARVQDLALDLALSEVEGSTLISRRVVRGDAGEVLSRASRGSVALVLGRPSGSGHVAAYCWKHAAVPVIVVPTDGDGLGDRPLDLDGFS